MTGLSPSGETAVLASILTTAYVSLHTADPGTTGTSEISGGAYARQGPVAFANTGSEPTTASNSAVVSFPTATAAWGSIGWFGIWNAATVGTFEGSGALDAAKTINSGDQARFLAGALTVVAT
jgi:hypothetical protein